MQKNPLENRQFDALIPEARMVQFIDWSYTATPEKLVEELQFYEDIVEQLSKDSGEIWNSMVGPSLREFRMRRDYLRGVVVQLITEP